MWLLITSTGKLIYLKSNISLSIGRKKCDILLSHDASVSKLHASIVVKPHNNVMIGKPTSSCILKDEGSKYGTFISKNGTFEKVITDVHLKDQDLIRIGLQKEIFTVKYISIISMTSALQDNEKEKLLKIMNVIDGIITTDWNKYCTHLTVVKPKLTQKVAVSLAACIPIVCIDYWDAVKTNIEMGEPLPETDKFTPKINEQYISKISTSLSPNYERKTLFTNLTFNFFSTKQYELYKTMIQLAGGKSILFNPNNEKNDTFEPNFIFVHYSVTNTDTQLAEDFIQGYDYIRKKLNTCKHRFIPESEIPLAILYCSTKQYCNSKFNFGNCLKRQVKSNCKLPETLVFDTQDQGILTVENVAKKQKSCHNKHTNYIAETLENDNDTSMQDNAMSQENLHNLKEVIPKKEHSTLKKLFIPETIESPSSSQINIDCCIKQNSNYNSFEASINGNTKEMHTSISGTFGKEHIATDEYDNEQVVTSDVKEVSPAKPQICIPETIDDSYSDYSEKCNKIPVIINSSETTNNFFKENNSNNVTIRNEIREDEKDTLITIKNISKAAVKENIQSPKNNGGRRMAPGKIFQKAYIKIPEKRKRLMNITEKN